MDGQLTFGFILGTRPEVLKLGPVIQKCESLPEIAPVLIDTQQQDTLKRQALSDLDLTPSHQLPACDDHGLPQKLAHMLVGLDGLLKAEKLDCVIVQGDTLSALAGTLAGFYRSLPVVHVEAGLRSHTLAEPFPEEAHRSVIARMASLHLAPNQTAVDQLLAEGIAGDNVALIGNPLIDLLDKPSDGSASPDVLITFHRRENFSNLQSLIGAVIEMASQFPDQQFWLIKHSHPRTLAALKKWSDHQLPNLSFCDPMAHADFLAALRSCRLVVTDSGGVQEESAHWQKQCLLVRNVADRPDGIDAGTTQVVGTNGSDLFDHLKSQLEGDPDQRLHLPHQAQVKSEISARIVGRIKEFLVKGV